MGLSVVSTFSFGFLLRMGSALETLCGQAYGAGNWTCWASTRSGPSWDALRGLWPFARLSLTSAVMLFTGDRDMQAAVGKVAHLLAATMVLNSVQPLISGVAIGGGWQALVAYINLGCYYADAVRLSR